MATSCSEKVQITPMPELLLDGEIASEVLDTLFNLNGATLQSGLSGEWEVISHTDAYSLADPTDPNCEFGGELFGEYQLKWIVTNGEEDKEASIAFKIGGFTDSRDDEQYRVIQIGDQIWMQQNLRTVYYQNGDVIKDGTGIGSVVEEDQPQYQYAYDDDPNNISIYGRLYTGYVASDSRGIAPEGWHLPSNSEWITLIEYLGGSEVAGGKMKEEGLEHWPHKNVGASNESGFTALGCGFRADGDYFVNIGGRVGWWIPSSDPAATEASIWYLGNGFADIFKSSNIQKVGMSVRCIRN